MAARKPRKKVQETPVVVSEPAKPDSVFEGIPAPKEAVTIAAGDLSTEQKAEFARLLRAHSSLEDRAKQLVKLASFIDTKRVPVALRAIQEINAITGITADAPEEGSPMFVLPEGAEMAVAVKVPKK